MPKKAYVLIETETSKADAVAKVLQSKPGVVAADVVTGPYDVIAILQGKDADDVARMVIHEIQVVKGVSHTMTCMAIGSSTGSDSKIV
jgi:DNA-binding Lrp family transcriptional regulator